MSSKATLQIRVNKETKNKAKRVFKDLGIDMSSGVKLFLSQVVNTGSIPFTPITKNGFSLGREKEILDETDRALKEKKSYKTARSLHKALQ